MPCPYCRKEFPIPPEGMAGLPQNTFVGRMVEVTRISEPSDRSILCESCTKESSDDEAVAPSTATQYCIQCHRNICERCSQEHRQTKELEGHKVFPLGSPLTEDLLQEVAVQYCGLHGKEVKLYCCDCKQVICTLCADEAHGSHKVRDVEGAADEFRDGLARSMGQLKVCSKEASEKMQRIVKEQSDFHKGVEDTEQAVIQRANQLKDIVDQCTQFLLDELEEFRQRELNQVEN